MVFDDYNIQNFDNYTGGVLGTFHCICCGKKTRLDDSYSNRGKNLMCCLCVSEKARQLDMTVGNFIKKYIWEE